MDMVMFDGSDRIHDIKNDLGRVIDDENQFSTLLRVFIYVYKCCAL